MRFIELLRIVDKPGVAKGSSLWTFLWYRYLFIFLQKHVFFAADLDTHTQKGIALKTIKCFKICHSHTTMMNKQEAV